jgi:hypothetical protein
VEYAVFVKRSLADHPVAVFHVGSGNVGDVLVAVLLTYPFCRTVVQDGFFFARPRLANGQGGLIFTASDDMTFPARLSGHLVHGRRVLCEHWRRQGKGECGGEQQQGQLLQHVFLLSPG